MQLPDTRIALSGISRGGGDDNRSNPFGTLGQMMQIKEQQSLMQQRERQAEQQRREMEDDDETRSALQQDQQPEQAIDHLWKGGRASAASKLSLNVYNARKAQLEEADARVKGQAAAFGQAAQIASSIYDDATLKNATPALLALAEPSLGKGVRDMIPTTYDKAKVDQLVKAGTTLAQQHADTHNRIQRQLQAHASGYTDALVDPDTGEPMRDPVTGELSKPRWSQNGLQTMNMYQENLARDLASAPNKEVYDQYLQQHFATGTPKSLIDKFPPWKADGSSPAIAAALGMTLPQQATASAAAQRAETAAEAEDRRSAAAGGGKGLTRPQQWQVEDTQEKENEETDKWAEATYQKDFPMDKWPREKNERGIEKRVPVPFGVERLTPAHQQEFAKRKLATENKARRRRGYPSIEDDAKAAATRGDVDGYAAAAKAYKDLTVIGDLEKIVKPPKGYKKTDFADVAAGSSSASGGAASQPAASRPNAAAAEPAAKRQGFSELNKQFSLETDPAKRAALKKQMLSLFGM